MTPMPSRRRFVLLLLATLTMILILQRIDVPLRTDAVPQGIVSFEFAGSQAVAQRILAAWDERARVYAAFSLGFDYLFMLTYAVTLALACRLAEGPWQARTRRGGALGEYLAVGQLAAALFDGVENLGLWRILAGATADGWPILAALCAGIKFVLIVLGLGYSLVGFGLFLQQRRAGRRSG